ncbi:uncharacterized protein LOC132266410 [Cornus florida]|uniref:uncharacterized protein LOC132266410 n=1 Tax=Cornus florida TaxID=4283 RepID=UPI00289F8C10|nr:uncharacterized protein LOC132266410 [Cornus florida]
MSEIVLEKVDEMYAQKVLEEMIELAGTKTGFLRQRIETLVDFMILVAEQDQVFEEKTRHLAVEFIITVAEDREQGCLMIQNLPQSINKLLGLFMNMLLFIEDDPSWSEASSDDKNAGETDMYCYGMGCLGRFAVALRGNAISSNFPDLFPSFLDDSEWTKRHAGVTALGLIAEGCSKVIKQNSLSLFVEKVLLLFQDSHPRVRWAAINAIGHLSNHLGPQLQEKFHQRLIPALIAAMDDFQNPRVQAHAASTMLLFSQSCTSNILKPYLKGILRKLLDLLQKEKRMLKDGALTTIASIANSSMEYFREYYSNVMPYLKVIWESGLDIPNDHILVAKSVECVTMIGMAVGKEMFGSDAEEVVNMLIFLQKHDSEPGDPMRIHLLQAWSRLCKCLGQEFLPYLSVSMPHLLQSAQLKCYRLITNPDNNDESDDESMEEVAFGSGGFGININVLEEKALACNVLCCYAAELKGALHLWIDEVAKTLVPLLKFSFHDKVRTAAVSAMPLILHSVIAAMNRGLYLPGFKESPIKILSRTIIQALVEALHEESRTKIRTRILDSLNKCMQISGSLLEKSQLTYFTDVIIEVLTACSFKITERVKEEDVDAALELLEEEIIEEEKAFNMIEDCLGTLIKTSKASFLTLSNNLFPCLKLMWGNDRTLKERTIALRVLYDVAEQCREEAFRYYGTCLPFLNKACNDENPEVRQVVARGISICAEFGGSVFKPHVDEALSNLKAVMEHPNALQPDNIMTYEVAVSAFGQICHLHCDSIGSYEVVSFWLSHLPLRNNLNEAKLVHDQLCSMIETSEENIFGPGDVNLPKIIAVLSEVLWAGDNLATAQTIYRMIKLLKQFQQKLQPSTLASLPLHHQNLIESIL